MKLSLILQYINQALNYPAITYQDVSLFFDTAISELNTTLHIAIPTVSQMIEEYQRELSAERLNTVRLSSDPSLSDFNIPTYESVAAAESAPYFFNTSDKYFYIRTSTTLGRYKEIRAIYITSDGTVTNYISSNLNNDDPFWQIIEIVTDDCEVSEYLPNDWITLWLIPYVCFKYTVRDGGTSQTFAEELTQGFQQLQNSYDVPYKVNLIDNAHKFAYKALVREYLPNLNTTVTTRAIYDSMKHSRAVNAIYGNMFDRGGF